MFHCILLYATMSYGVPLYPIVSHYILSYSTISYGVPLYPIMFHCILSYPTMSYGVPLYPIVPHYVLRCSTVSYAVPLYPMVFHYILWCSTVSYRNPLCPMVFHCILSCPLYSSHELFMFFMHQSIMSYFFFFPLRTVSMHGLGFDPASLDRNSVVFTTTPSQPDLKDIYFGGYLSQFYYRKE